MTIDEDKAVYLLSQMFLIQFSEEEQIALGMAIDALNFKKWYRSQDLISRDELVVKLVQIGLNGKHLKEIFNMPKAEPPKE